MRHLTLLVLILCLFVQPVVAGTGNHTVLVVPMGIHVQYWQGVKEGALQAGHERDVEIMYRGPRLSDDHEAQVRIIKTGIHDGVDAIVLAPNHTSEVVPLLEEATRKGIKVVIIDSESDFTGYVSYVASDNYEAGRAGALHLLSLVEKESDILLLRYKDGLASTMAREKGFLDVVAAAGSYTVVDAGYVGISVGGAYHKAYGELKNMPQIKGVFAAGEYTTLGALKALRELNIAGRVNLVGFDYTDEIHEALDEGVLDGTMVQSPYQMGYRGVMAACDALEGKPVKSRITTLTELVTGDNNDPEKPSLKLFLVQP